MAAYFATQAILNGWNKLLSLFLMVTPIDFSKDMARLKRSESPTAETMSATEEV